jgi:hypothetical protein
MARDYPDPWVPRTFSTWIVKRRPLSAPSTAPQGMYGGGSTAGTSRASVTASSGPSASARRAWPRRGRSGPSGTSSGACPSISRRSSSSPPGTRPGRTADGVRPDRAVFPSAPRVGAGDQRGRGPVVQPGPALAPGARRRAGRRRSRGRRGLPGPRQLPAGSPGRADHRSAAGRAAPGWRPTRLRPTR